MKPLRLRPSQTSSKREISQSQQKKASAEPPVKKISLFISNLDKHIEQSFTKIRKNREKGTPVDQDKFYGQYQSHYREESSLKEHSTLDGVSKLMYTSERKKYGEESRMYQSKQETNVQYLDNEEVNQYIQLVYEMYNIPDPLQGTQPIEKKQKISIRASRRTFSGTPSLRKKSSVSSFKEKMIQQRDIDLGPFHSSRKPQNYRERDNQVDISLLSSIQKTKTVHLGKPKVVKLRHTDAIPATTTLVSNSMNRSQSSVSTKFTSQTFRYCFACEATVLQANLKHHESECKMLQEALTKSMQEVLAILDNKIARLSRQIKQKFVEADTEAFVREYTKMKRSVAEWLTHVNQIDKENYRQNQAREKMAQLNQGWGQTVSEHCESISKLHWFSRLRENIRKTYQI